MVHDSARTAKFLAASPSIPYPALTRSRIRSRSSSRKGYREFSGYGVPVRRTINNSLRRSPAGILQTSPSNLLFLVQPKKMNPLTGLGLMPGGTPNLVSIKY